MRVKRPSLKKQAVERLKSIRASGGILGRENMGDFMTATVEFTEWAKSRGCRYLEDARGLVDQYLNVLKDSGDVEGAVLADLVLTKLYSSQMSDFEAETCVADK